MFFFFSPTKVKIPSFSLLQPLFAGKEFLHVPTELKGVDSKRMHVNVWLLSLRAPFINTHHLPTGLSANQNKNEG